MRDEFDATPMLCVLVHEQCAAQLLGLTGWILYTHWHTAGEGGMSYSMTKMIPQV